MSATLFWKLLIRVGFPTAISAVLLAALLGWVPSPLIQRLDTLEYRLWQNTIVIRTICHSILGNEERNRCEPWRVKEYE